jgi:hypothetical protein
MLQPNDIRFHYHGPLDRKTFGSLGSITSDEEASNVNPGVRNLVTTRVMYYTFSTTRSRVFLRPE